MSHIFIAINGDNVGDSIGNAIISDNHDELSRVSGSIKNAHQMIDQWVQAKGGKVIVNSGDEGIYQIPQQAANELDMLRNKYSKLANTTLTIGVGASMSEASKALIYGKMNNKNQIVHYEPAIDDYISGDGEAQAEEQAVEDQLPTEEEVTDQGNEQEEFAEGAAEGEEDAGEEGEEQFGEEGTEGEEADPEFSTEGEEDSEDDLLPADTTSPTEGVQTKQQNAALEEGKAAPKNKAQMPLDEAIDEHEQLVGTLKSPSKKDDKAEANKQGAELKQLKQQKQNVEQESQPEHEEGMGEEEDLAHDAQENQDDELDSDNIEADEEDEAFGAQTEPNEAGTEEDIDTDSESEEGEGEFSAEGEEELDPESMGDGTEEGDIPTEEDDEEGMGFGDESAEDDGAADPAAQDAMDGEEQDGIMSEMMHANMGDEEAEDSDDEIKQDIIESLMQFKAQRAALEEMKQTNPELYQSQIIILRSMIQMAKKLGMNPERGVAQAHMNQDTQDAFPAADDEADDQADIEATEQNPLLGKSEKSKYQNNLPIFDKETGKHKKLSYTHDKASGKVHGSYKGKKFSGDAHPLMAEDSAKRAAGIRKNIKPNNAQSVMNKAKVDEGKTPSQKQVARAYRNDRKKDEETKKITGTPKKVINDPKAFSKSKVEEMKIDLKKKPDVKKQ